MRWEVAGTKDETASTPAESTKQSGRSPRAGDVLVVNREPELRIFLGKALFTGGLSCTAVTSFAEALTCLRKGAYAAVVVGIDSPESIRFLESAHAEFTGTPMIAAARTATPELVRDLLRGGASDFLFGGTDARAVGQRIAQIATGGGNSPGPEVTAQREGSPGEREAAPRAESAPVEDTIVCRNKKTRRILEIAETVAPTDSTVLIQGESGTGKELIARRIHALSNRRDKPFVEVNCGALPENLLESQLFGHEKGSFTGAVQRQVGLFEIASGGTIFLDEIGEMSLDMQVKLLRVLQFKEFRRVGGSQVVRVNVRVIAATNKDLAAEVAKKHFRPDLFYRINVISLKIPPLRERLEEVPDLVERFTERFARERGAAKKTFSSEAIEKLQKCRWTGNVRELENAVERSILLSKGDAVEASEVEENLGDSAELAQEGLFAPTLTLDEVKRIHIANVLRQNSGNKMKTARILKINVKTLYNLMRRLDIKEQQPA